MNVSKFKLVLKLDKLAKNSNKAPICLRVTKERKSFYRTILHVEPEHWDAKNERIKNKHPNVVELNALLDKKVAEIKKEISLLEIRDDDVSIYAMKDKLAKRTSLDLFEHAQKEITKMYDGGQYATYKKYKSVIKKLKKYVNKDVLPIKDVTLDFVANYQDHLLHKVKNNINTTIVNLKALARLVNDIYDNSEYNLDQNKNPFATKNRKKNRKKIKMKREQTERTYLSAAEVKRIEKLRPRVADKMYDAKDVFLVECYTGLRISDILTLRWGNYDGNEFSVRMRKTDKAHIVKANKVVKRIIENRKEILERNNIDITPDKYIFGILKVDIEKASAHDSLNAISSATAIINKSLKEIAERAKIQKNISTHTGRHTFAYLMVAKNVNPFIMRDLLGHSDIRVTQIYAKSSKSDKDNAIDSLDDLEDLVIK
ncbi:MAG: site-specific integrase [Prevotella sp.]|jgi:integrase|nr:site-specific integrase [Prevotella sp.]